MENFVHLKLQHSCPYNMRLNHQLGFQTIDLDPQELTSLAEIQLSLDKRQTS